MTDAKGRFRSDYHGGQGRVDQDCPTAFERADAARAAAGCLYASIDSLARDRAIKAAVKPLPLRFNANPLTGPQPDFSKVHSMPLGQPQEE